MGKHLTPEASAMFQRVYEHHNGKWDNIMADPEIKALGVERWNLQHHMAYKKRRKNKKTKGVKRSSVTESFGSASSSSSSSSEENEEEEEEYELLAITGRKKGYGKTPAKWYAVYSDGDERWVPATCFIDLDGTTNEMFLQFQAKHQGDDYIKPIPISSTKKRAATVMLEEKEVHEERKKQRISEEEKQPLITKKEACIQILHALVMEEEDLVEEIRVIKEEIRDMRQDIIARLEEIAKLFK